MLIGGMGLRLGHLCSDTDRADSGGNGIEALAVRRGGRAAPKPKAVAAGGKPDVDPDNLRPACKEQHAPRLRNFSAAGLRGGG